MSKNRKLPAASRKTARKMEAPKLVTRTTTEAEVGHDDIARLAYERFLARGAHGFHVEDWLAAEAELRATPRA